VLGVKTVGVRKIIAKTQNGKKKESNVLTPTSAKCALLSTLSKRSTNI
jgi:hypothetical protein